MRDAFGAIGILDVVLIFGGAGIARRRARRLDILFVISTPGYTQKKLCRLMIGFDKLG